MDPKKTSTDLGKNADVATDKNASLFLVVQIYKYCKI